MFFKLIKILQNNILTKWVWCYWQHEETGCICMLPFWKSPGRRYYNIGIKGVKMIVKYSKSDRMCRMKVKTNQCLKINTKIVTVLTNKKRCNPTVNTLSYNL